MIHKIILDRLEKDAGSTLRERSRLFREIVQELSIYSLSSAGFFEKAVFHGGTELRIAHSLPRFSEDLDFMLRSPDRCFSWDSYRERLLDTCQRFGLNPYIKEKPSPKGAVRAIILVDNTRIGVNPSGRESYTRIRLEIDTDPPPGTVVTSAFLDFPVPHEIVVSDLPSSFALKCHALLCRVWMKGRDWFDLLWFISKGIKPDMNLFSNAMHQNGPWAGRRIQADEEWLGKALAEKVENMAVEDLIRDIVPFVAEEDRSTVESWSREMFLHYIHRAFPF